MLCDYEGLRLNWITRVTQWVLCSYRMFKWKQPIWCFFCEEFLSRFFTQEEIRKVQYTLPPLALMKNSLRYQTERTRLHQRDGRRGGKTIADGQLKEEDDRRPLNKINRPSPGNNLREQPDRCSYWGG